MAPNLIDVSRLWTVTAVNIAVVGGLVALTADVDHHLASEIHQKQAHYGACATHLRKQLTKHHARKIRLGSPKFRHLLRTTTHKRCRWSDLARQRPADIAGSAFLVVALGLFDVLLWKIWRKDAGG
jgi:hypothetical protein